jgi:hypothetical protein
MPGRGGRRSASWLDLVLDLWGYGLAVLERPLVTFEVKTFWVGDQRVSTGSSNVHYKRTGNVPDVRVLGISTFQTWKVGPAAENATRRARSRKAGG